MNTFRHYQLFLIVLIGSILVFACGKATLSPQETKGIEHFKRAQESFLESSTYLKKLTKNSAIVGSMSEGERNTYIKMLTETLSEAKSVSDSTLAKIHPKLPSAYHSIFILCIENKLRGFRDFDPKASIQGTELHNMWIDCWNAHYKEFAKI
jgi:hypothetical protein